MNIRGFILSIGIIFFAFSAQAQKIKISLNLKPDFIFETELINSISFIQEIMGINFTTSTNISNVLTSQVIEKSDDTGYKLKSHYSRMEFSLNNNGMDLKMSSEANEDDNPMNSMMKFLVDQDFIQTISLRGDVWKTKGLDELILNVLDSLDLSSDQLREFKDAFIRSFGAETLAETFMLNSTIYTDSLVDEGDSWVKNFVISPYGIPMNLKLNIMVKHILGDYAIFMTEGILEAKNDTLAPSPYQLEGTQVSEFKINLRNGLIENNITTQYIQGMISISSQDSSENIEIPVTIKSRSNIRSTEKKSID